MIAEKPPAGTVRDNLSRLKDRIAEAAARASRTPEEITLVGVSKTVTPEAVREAIEAGLTEIGENRVQEAQPKIEALAAVAEAAGRPVRWHMIGHLQRNKAKAAVGLFDLIQSLDSRRLAEAVNKAALESGAGMDVLCEVNTSDEESKFGLSPSEVVKFVAQLADLKGLRIKGLMTVGPLVADPDEARPAFRRLRELSRTLEAEGFPWVQMRYLSMGMTNDFEQAIEEGSNMVRVGTAIFGRRSRD
jgi:pyridoxal phosphate enzyme (YggS family)